MQFEIPVRKSEEKRQYRRVKFGEPVRLTTKDQKSFIGNLACDLSQGGARVHLNDFLALGEEVCLSVRLEAEKVVECMAKIAWIKQIPHSERYMAGLEFTGEQAEFHREHTFQYFIDRS